MKKIRYNIGFRCKHQLALFEIIKKEYINDQLDYASIIFQIKGLKYKKHMKEWLNSN
jgi:hypothetical protein